MYPYRRKHSHSARIRNASILLSVDRLAAFTASLSLYPHRHLPRQFADFLC